MKWHIELVIKRMCSFLKQERSYESIIHPVRTPPTFHLWAGWCLPGRGQVATGRRRGRLLGELLRRSKSGEFALSISPFEAERRNAGAHLLDRCGQAPGKGIDLDTKAAGLAHKFLILLLVGMNDIFRALRRGRC